MFGRRPPRPDPALLARVSDAAEVDLGTYPEDALAVVGAYPSRGGRTAQMAYGLAIPELPGGTGHLSAVMLGLLRHLRRPGRGRGSDRAAARLASRATDRGRTGPGRRAAAQRECVPAAAVQRP
jgi:hypothetical protein